MRRGGFNHIPESLRDPPRVLRDRDHTDHTETGMKRELLTGGNRVCGRVRRQFEVSVGIVLRVGRGACARPPCVAAPETGALLCKWERRVPAFAGSFDAALCRGKRSFSKARLRSESPTCGTWRFAGGKKFQQSGGMRRHLGGIWPGTGRTGNEFRPDWFAQMPAYAALCLLVPPFFRKFYRGCLHTANMRTATMADSARSQACCFFQPTRVNVSKRLHE
ncbi:MAG: hypothetical protein JWR26_3931 [Pedosphaera sp.]|nr:hypothetical protein [Pedosphaera sp.]